MRNDAPTGVGKTTDPSGQLCDVWTASEQREEVLRPAFVQRQGSSEEEEEVQTVGKREVRTTPSGKKLTVVVMGLSTYYFFRGPRSHRQVMVSVRHPFYARFREEQALDKANKRDSWYNVNEFRRFVRSTIATQSS